MGRQSINSRTEVQDDLVELSVVNYMLGIYVQTLSRVHARFEAVPSPPSLSLSVAETEGSVQLQTHQKTSVNVCP